MGKLLLFDIDGTLVDTGGAGMHALQEAALVVFGDRGPPLDLAGSTDAGIVLGMLSHFGRSAEFTDIQGFYRIYLERLEWNLLSGSFSGKVLPGVAMLLRHLASAPDAHLGLLTGNIEDGAMLKMRHYQLDSYFGVGAFGNDHHDRNQLGPVALRRASDHFGVEFSTRDVWVIGDTPKDIACARALGAPCLAVATGRFSARELTEHGADRVMEDFADSLAVAEVLLG
jgi:phosphoglycolate phosphatase